MSDVDCLLLEEKGPSNKKYIRRRLDINPDACRFYTFVIAIISINLLVLYYSLDYVFVHLPLKHTEVKSLDGRLLVEAPAYVQTQCGPVEGSIEQDVYVFKGIPYASPPVGSKRWERPQELPRENGTCWKNTLQAKQFGSSCPQTVGINNFTAFMGSEDCLFLNVWTPSLDPQANLTVMFWIHGGYLIFGSGNMTSYCPTAEVTKATRAVFVSINYRLGPFGFLTLDTLSQSSASGTSGNYGLMDMIFALQWVKNNIRNFGGNPDKVTVFGQSSGGTAIHALLASPLASGLFQRAWLASASAILNKTSTQASRDNLVFLNMTGCATAACLRSLSTTKIMQGSPWTVFPYWAMLDLTNMPEKGHFDGALAVVDGYVLNEAPLDAWKGGRSNDVPTLFTTTAQEIDFLPFDPTISSWSWPHYTATVRQQLTQFSEDIADKALQLYPVAGVGDTYTPEYQYTSMVSDIRVTCPIDVLAKVAAQHFQSKVFRADTTAAPSAPVDFFHVFAAQYAFHMWDLLAFFGDFESLGFQPTDTDLDFQRVMRQQVMAFARDGQPEASGWDTALTCTALLSDRVYPVEQYRKNRCDFWLGHGFFSYAWIN